MLAQYRRALEAQVRSREVADEMKKVRTEFGVFKRYATVADLAQLVNAQGKNYKDKDAVLVALVAQTQQKPVLFPVLNLMFWDSLAVIFNAKRSRTRDIDELFARIQAEFFYVVFTYPLDRRPLKVDVNLVLDTKMRVTRWQRQEAKLLARHEPLPDDERNCRRLAEFEDSEFSPGEMEAYLLELLRCGVIDESQCDLLLETDIHKRMTQKEWAEARDVTYDAARKMHQRAEEAIREHEERRRRAGINTDL